MSDLGGEGVQDPDWTALPPELLRLISERVAEIGDYVRFGAVCKPWLSAASPASNLPPQIPWLLLPYDPDTTVRRFYSISSRRTYTFDLPTVRGYAICSSVGGWLLTVDASLSFSLLNPLTQHHIHLPPLSASLNHYHVFLDLRDSFASDIYGCLDPKTQLLMTPEVIRTSLFLSNSGEIIIAVILGGGEEFVYCKAHDHAWIRRSSIPEILIDTISYYDDRFYIIYTDGQVSACEFCPEEKLIVLPSLAVPIDYVFSYFVAVAGELLLLSWDSDESLVYSKMDVTGQHKWSKINDIGDHTLFLTATNAIAVDVCEATECRRNRIYMCRLHRSPSPLQRLFIIMVEVGSSNHLLHFEEEYSPDHLQSIWCTPSLC